MTEFTSLLIRRKTYRWLKLSSNEIEHIRKTFKILSPEAKKYFNISPFLSIVLTQQCTLKCKYCGEGGEGTYSTKVFHDMNILKKRIEEALEIGVKKIRLTGGEPFLYQIYLIILRK